MAFSRIQGGKGRRARGDNHLRPVAFSAGDTLRTITIFLMVAAAFQPPGRQATHLTRGDMSIPRSRLALKAKIRKDFAFKIEIRNLRKARRREGMGVDGLPLVVGDKGGGGTGLRLRIGGT